MVNTNSEHGSDCTCGCHDHDHEHAHDHDHGHHHDHAAGREVECRWGTAVLESHVHDQAATVSATIRAQSGSAATFEVLVEGLRSVAQHVESAGGIVGHIKAYARADGSFVHASATDAQHEPSCEGDASLPLGPEVCCQLVAIALLIDLGQLEQIVVDALN